jgi:hypothetical protein
VKVKALKRCFFIYIYTSTDAVTMFKEMFKTHLTVHCGIIFAVKKSNEVTFFRKECNELLVIHFLHLGVAVPLQFLVTDV